MKKTKKTFWQANGTGKAYEVIEKKRGFLLIKNGRRNEFVARFKMDKVFTK